MSIQSGNFCSTHVSLGALTGLDCPIDKLVLWNGMTSIPCLSHNVCLSHTDELGVQPLGERSNRHCDWYEKN